MTGKETRAVECPGCGSSDLSKPDDISAKICDVCGLVCDDAEWITATPEPPTHDEGEAKEDNKNWEEDITVADASDQQLVQILSVLDTAANGLTISDEIRARSADVVIESWNQHLMHGRQINTVVAATIYLTCREAGQPRPSHAIADLTDTDKQQIFDTAQVIQGTIDFDFSVVGASEYIGYLADELSVSDATAVRASEKLTNTNSIGGEPAAVAAAALYVASHATSDQFTLSEAGNAAGVTKETVWRHTTKIDQRKQNTQLS
ncbi:hypothetical protein [Halorubrum vacuolatum]|uniref:Transcription initiation factor TFIIIB, Brf1 subunit/Transcription initiation factor TFIIB n=1 Tax=Halorubrum vacuolatum TaxID=63740 RepID=A0A238Y1N0_HALVU|nr:hypothetical protein [Halorubrum vacuolatum]SNR64691.1 Transcription initiation factor TFIIIB, Brf1 subunit/Transcription initiation factor TFIIB [Halorubrum vacuolatum]